MAFQSSATNLVPGDTNNATDIFARGASGSGSYLVTISPRQLVAGRDFGNAPTQRDVAVTVAGPAGPVLTDTIITYTFSYRNLGTAAAQTTQLVDALPAGLSFLSATGGGAFDPLTGTVTFALGTLAANDDLLGGPDEGSVTATALVVAGAAGQLSLVSYNAPQATSSSRIAAADSPSCTRLSTTRSTALRSAGSSSTVRPATRSRWRRRFA